MLRTKHVPLRFFSNDPHAPAYPWKVPGQAAMAVVYSDGSITFIPDIHYKTLCGDPQESWEIDTCELKFGSWTYNGFKIDIQLMSENGADTSSYISNPKFEVFS